ncbi:MAG: ADP-ribosylglycohydrolase family protein [Spirochaetota bacterium]|nr:ADP-ribosylglycohydrolase family protein [Spirochaetota bacterium]
MKPIERALLSLNGLSVGDSLGECFFVSTQTALSMIEAKELPESPWRYTDDTEMAISIVEVLHRCDGIDPDTLADLFASRYNPLRGYGSGAHRLLQSYREGKDWRIESRKLFGGSGSYGNGSAMRIAPLGAYFAENLNTVRDNAILSARPTHAHPEATAGAIAIAIGAAIAWRAGEGKVYELSAKEYLEAVIEHVPKSKTGEGIIKAIELLDEKSSSAVANILGSGQRVSSQDTVPFVLWCASKNLYNFVDAFWDTVRGLGDRDTTCAMAGGIVSLSDRLNGIPKEWLKAREPLPLVFLL